jgi:hypothetical protein
VILELLASGAVNLTAVRLLAPHLTETNHLDVLDSARGKTTFQVREIVARLSPRPDVPTAIHKLPAPWPESSSPTGAAVLDQTEIAPASSVESPAAPPPVPLPVTRTDIRPLSPDRSRPPPEHEPAKRSTVDAVRGQTPSFLRK